VHINIQINSGITINQSRKTLIKEFFLRIDFRRKLDVFHIEIVVNDPIE